MSNGREEAVRQLAHAKWEREGKPDGRHEQHWQEAEAESKTGSSLPQVTQAVDDGHVQAGAKTDRMGGKSRGSGRTGSIKQVE
ncbi:DUF2934 domain-containing protein [Rhizobium indicum]|uniref:DUF2934 domain-containing protein n=1 Tax=Rhizobium indicum TaxID=2583231 RepID=A0ABX6PP44_9HYPH|nr:DUF2934 domain-containing protein [Rhizobium indicum]QKK20440.1 DUF2934 domain-containing protein [Rhizobium indicum]